MIIDERVLPLQGGRNFRDLGGYQTVSGATVKWGMLYRSGVMSGLTDEDYVYLKGLGIVEICDFRATEERAHEPTDWQAIGAKNYTSFDYEDPGLNELRAVFMKGDFKPDDIAQAMTELYGTMVDRFVPHYKDMFARLIAGQAPLAFNCSAGKDRTGIAAALVLSALGVPRDIISADYALSDRVVDYEAIYNQTVQDGIDSNSPHAFLAFLPAPIRAPLLKSDPVYLEAALTKIENNYGSIESYLHKELQVSQDDVKKLQSLYLQFA
jgi:protein-tyrosine phosphatase